MANREKGRRRGGRQGGERRTGGRGQRISNSSEAGLSGQDAFQDGDDEISLEPGFAEGTSKHISGLAMASEQFRARLIEKRPF